jgi:hypothetical protein
MTKKKKSAHKHLIPGCNCGACKARCPICSKKKVKK